MKEKLTSPELPGRVYENVKDLSDEIRAFREKNLTKLGGQPDNTAVMVVLRIFGKQMAQYEKPDGGKYWTMEDGDEKCLVSASIYKEDDYRVVLNIYDYRKWAASGGKERPELIYNETLDKKNIKDFHLQLALKRIKPQKQDNAK